MKLTRPRAEIVLWMGLSLLCPLTFAVAQEVSVTAQVEPRRVAVDDSFTVSLAISGAARDLEAPSPPRIDEFASYIGSSSTQRYQWANGQAESSLIYEYRFFATRKGEFEIPAISVQVKGKTYSSQPIKISIGDRRRTGPGGGRLRSSPSAGQKLAKDDLFVRVLADKRRVYQNQPVIVEYRIYTRVNVSSYSISTPPTTEGFWVENFELPDSPAARFETYRGERFTTATIKKMALFPTSPGTKTIGRMQLEAEVRLRFSRSRDPFDNFFGLRGLGLGGRTANQRIEADPLEIEVLPLPSAGRPDNFSGVVGRLDVTASIDKKEVLVNQAVTLKLTVSGHGNLRVMEAPRIRFPSDFETYPPKLSERIRRDDSGVRGSKTYEYVVIPRRPGSVTIPSVELSYFDPGSRSYRMAQSGPLVLEVEGDPGADIIFGPSRSQVRSLREDIRFIKSHSSLRPIGQGYLGSGVFWVVMLLPCVAVAAAWGCRRHWDRLQGDVGYARSRRAGRLARRRLAQARSLLSSGEPSAFYAEIDRALLGFAADKLNLPSAGLTASQLEGELRRIGVSEATLNSVAGCLKTCDLKRFSPASGDRDEMPEMLRRAEQAMNGLEREVKK